MIFANAIVTQHDKLTRAWHSESGEGGPSNLADVCDAVPDDSWPVLLARHHRANFDLWHIEDEARTPGATDSALADLKRRIDVVNQARNDLMEEADHEVLARLADRNLPNPAAPLHSESPGLMIDRLSILALKIYHTSQEAKRADAPTGHIERNRERLAILEEQRNDLAGCLDALWNQTLAGTRRFKVYRQLKMYNDPALNPAIYRVLKGNSPN